MFFCWIVHLRVHGKGRVGFIYKSNHTITCFLVQIALQQIRIQQKQKQNLLDVEYILLPLESEQVIFAVSRMPKKWNELDFLLFLLLLYPLEFGRVLLALIQSSAGRLKMVCYPLKNANPKNFFPHKATNPAGTE